MFYVPAIIAGHEGVCSNFNKSPERLILHLTAVEVWYLCTTSLLEAHGPVGCNGKVRYRQRMVALWKSLTLKLEARRSGLQLPQGHARIQVSPLCRAFREVMASLCRLHTEYAPGV